MFSGKYHPSGTIHIFANIRSLKTDREGWNRFRITANKTLAKSPWATVTTKSSVYDKLCVIDKWWNITVAVMYCTHFKILLYQIFMENNAMIAPISQTVKSGFSRLNCSIKIAPVC